MAKITRERAERIARAHACIQCREYSYKRLTVKPATAEQRDHLKEAWHAVAVCGVCDLEQEIGISATGEIVYVA